MTGLTDTMLRRFAEAHDREEAAQIGEPSPWDNDDLDPDWIEARLSCVRAGLAATDWRARALAAEAEVERLLSELSGNTGELRDAVAAAIRADGSDLCDGPWGTLPEANRLGWRGDAERALAAVKDYLTAGRLPQGNRP